MLVMRRCLLLPWPAAAALAAGRWLLMLRCCVLLPVDAALMAAHLPGC